jgi:hypothetical protein
MISPPDQHGIPLVAQHGSFHPFENIPPNHLSDYVPHAPRAPWPRLQQPGRARVDAETTEIAGDRIRAEAA